MGTGKEVGTGTVCVEETSHGPERSGSPSTEMLRARRLHDPEILGSKREEYRLKGQWEKCFL